jgi:two-component system NarL family sensor kinase
MQSDLIREFCKQNPGCEWIVDSSGVFREVFGDAVRYLGRTTDLLVGHKATEFLDGAEGSAWSGRIARVLAGETLSLRERKGGGVWYVSVFPICTAGETYVAGIAREVSPWTEAENELRQAVWAALETRLMERRQLSRFLHDSVGQNLTALGLQLDLLRMDLEPPAPPIGERIREIQSLLEQVMQEVRDYTYELDPCALERAGLRPALDRLVERLGQRFGGRLRIHADPSLRFPEPVAQAFYRIAAEAADNSTRHSGCSTIEIALKSTRGRYLLEVKDNGKGFDPADTAHRRGLGLLSMQFYAAQAGLELAITSNPDDGTLVRASSPEVR